MNPHDQKKLCSGGVEAFPIPGTDQVNFLQSGIGEFVRLPTVRTGRARWPWLLLLLLLLLVVVVVVVVAVVVVFAYVSNATMPRPSRLLYCRERRTEHCMNFATPGPSYKARH